MPRILPYEQRTSGVAQAQGEANAVARENDFTTKLDDVHAAERAADEAEEALIEQSLRLGCLPCDSTITAAHTRAEQFKTWARAVERLAAQLNGEN